MPSLCTLCNARKPKRACPGLGRQICAVCCGTKRLTEISCPPTCSYLAASRTHPPAVTQRRQERDLRFILPLLTELTEPQYQLLLLFQAITVKHSATAMPPLIDADVADAAATVASTLETAGKGIIYKHQATSIPAQRLVQEIEAAMSELVNRAEARGPALERDAAVALRQLARAATEAAKSLPEDEPPVLLKLLARIMTKPETDSDGAVVPARSDASSRLVIPG